MLDLQGGAEGRGGGGGGAEGRGGEAEGAGRRGRGGGAGRRLLSSFGLVDAVGAVGGDEVCRGERGLWKVY